MSIRAKLPPGPRAPRVVQLLNYLRDPARFLAACHQRYGDVFTIRWPSQPPMVYFTTPSAVSDIFKLPPHIAKGGEANSVLDFIAGEKSVARLDTAEHKKRRKLLMPPFHARGLGQYADLMGQNTQEVMDTNGGPTSFQHISQSLSLQNLISCCFSFDDPRDAKKLHDLMIQYLKDSLNPSMALLWTTLPGVPLRKNLVRLAASVSRRRWIPNRVLPFWQLGSCIQEIDTILSNEIQHRRTHGTQGRSDILSLLTDAKDTNGESMSEEELREEMMAILVAGHETTATTMDWAVLEYLKNPKTRAGIDAELKSVLAGDAPSAKHVGQMPRLLSLIQECLRFYPAVPSIGRVSTQSLEVAGVALPKGIVVVPCIYLVQRHPRFWNKPDVFDAERFLDGPPPKAAFIPFGGGTRTCLGKSFANFELQIVLATIFSAYAIQARGKLPSGNIAQRGLFTGVPGDIAVVLRKQKERPGPL